ncbi:ATP-binding protein [Streptomyces coelicoflavus]|uniref:ATP-binding protein n=1 Tax=Streptomyces coelicoflavus TaxID=285562 RepID=UPI000D596D03|nr:ATP-binding protein [Streptomyces coelicoflavus]
MSHPALLPKSGDADPPSTPVPGRAVVDMRAREQGVRAARRFTAAVLARWGVHGEHGEAAVLIVSELATNAVRHGRSDLTVALALAGDTLRIDVTDHGAPSAPPRPPAPGECGRGLDIVGCLADRTETVRHPWGRRVSAVIGVGGPGPAG